jgi:hypothetical protein
VGSDLLDPRVEGKRTAQVRFINWYIEKFFRAAYRDAVLAKKFLQVANLIEQPMALLDPRIAMRVWSGNRALPTQIMRPRRELNFREGVGYRWILAEPQNCLRGPNVKGVNASAS